MPNNNPGGENGYLAYGVESPYGTQKRLEESTRAAPIPSAPGMNAPKRAQRRAVKGQQPIAEPPLQQQLAQAPPAARDVWGLVAQIPGISPLAAEWANDA